jgi:dihydrodipicolinate synthase/N-acetylneuraminate lyase
MGQMDLLRPLRGLINPMATPLATPDQLDVAGVERLVPHILAGGVSALFILGTTGEGPSLSHRTRRELIERVTRLAGTKVPVLVAITDTSRQESVELANFAAEQGASGLVLAAPYYYPMTQADLAGYVERLAPELPLPFFLYNMPSHTKVDFEPDTVRRLADLPNVHGLKDSSGDLDYFRSVHDAVGDRSDFALLMGPEELLVEAMRIGAHGGVCGGSNVFPELFVKLYQAARDGRRAEIVQLQDLVVRFGRGVYTAGDNYLRGLKCALSLAGLCSDVMAEPFQPVEPGDRNQVRHTMQDLGLLPQPVSSTL